MGTANLGSKEGGRLFGNPSFTDTDSTLFPQILKSTERFEPETSPLNPITLMIFVLQELSPHTHTDNSVYIPLPKSWRMTLIRYID